MTLLIFFGVFFVTLVLSAPIVFSLALSALALLWNKGMQVNEGDREAFRKAVLPLRDEAVKEFGPKAKEWIERIEATK